MKRAIAVMLFALALGCEDPELEVGYGSDLTQEEIAARAAQYPCQVVSGGILCAPREE